jgi:DNA-binding transcriptional MerR regulator
MFTIGQISKKCALSRSTLIYYDKIGVLSPSGRSESNYRLYSAADLERMNRIQVFRSAGLSLQAIASLLNTEGGDLNTSLEQRLVSINSEIQGLRNQQKVILRLLQDEDMAQNSRVMTKETWVSMLKAAGLDEQGRRAWHIEFEKSSPEAHQDFLESLGIDDAEIALIRQQSKTER